MPSLIPLIYFGAIQMSLLPGHASPLLRHHDVSRYATLLQNNLPLPMKRSIKAHYFEDNMDDFNFMVSFPNAWRLQTNQDQPMIADYINVIDSKIARKRSTASDDLTKESIRGNYYPENNSFRVLPISIFQKYLADTMSKIKLRL